MLVVDSSNRKARDIDLAGCGQAQGTEHQSSTHPLAKRRSAWQDLYKKLYEPDAHPQERGQEDEEARGWLDTEKIELIAKGSASNPPLNRLGTKYKPWCEI